MTRSTSIRNKEQLAQKVVLSVSQILSRDMSHDRALRETLEVMCEQMSWSTAAFWIPDDDRRKLKCEMFYSIEKCSQFEEITRAIKLKKGEGLPGRVWKLGAPQWIDDVVEDANFPRARQAKSSGLHAAFAFPMSVKGKCIGVFEFFSKRASSPDSGLLNAFSVVGTELGQFFERRRIEEALAHQAKLNNYAAEIGMALNKADALSAIMQTCAEITVREVDAFLADVWIVSESTNRLELGARARASSRIDLGIPSKQYEKIIQTIAKQKTFETSDDLAAPMFFAAFPLITDENVLGVIAVFAKQRTSSAMLDVLARVSNNIALCMARKHSEQKLFESEGRFREFADVVDEVFFVGSPKLTEFYYVSPAYQKVWGAPPQEVLADPRAWSKVIIPEHRERVANYVDLLAGENMPAQSEIDYAITRPDGKKAWMSARCFRIDQGDGAWHICGTVRDITDRKEAEQRVSDFYTMVSHELRTPLTSIKGSLLLMERGKAGNMTDRAQDLILLARNECDRLIRLINDFLDIKTIEAGRLQLYQEDLNVAQLVTKTIQTMSSFASERKIVLREEIESRDTIFADRDRITQVLTNLLSNAIKYSPESSSVTVRVEKAGKFIRFAVIDQGPGIAREYQDKLFKVFQQIATKDTRKGTGLGLAICKGIVDEHGGRIAVSSEFGKGATFFFELPLRST